MMRAAVRSIVPAAALLLASPLLAQEPELPAGLGGEEPSAQQPSGQQPSGQEPGEPSLPSGLGGDEPKPQQPDGPQLPTGLGDAPEPPTDTEDVDDTPPLPWRITGFFDVRAGVRTQRDAYERDASLGEARLRLEAERNFEPFFVRLRADLIGDALARSQTVDLETGDGFVDLREASVATSPLPWMDVKVGRQVLTWGTGDLLFINDLFPKDWVAFFVGRDTEYLKAPSDALRVGMFSDLGNLEVVYTPRFDSDRFVSGERVSYYNPLLMRTAGRDARQNPDVPDDWFDDSETSLRLSQNVAGFELAAYGYFGRWKSPGGFDPMTLQVTFPRLNVYGASARTQLAGGVANVELGYYDSRSDRGGDDPTIENSQVRALVGFERDLPEVADAFTVGAQYYVEHILQHDDFLRTLQPGQQRRDELRHVVTLRVTKLLWQQRLRLSLFGYVSPNDHDAYLRPNASYTIDDVWSLSVGGNVFLGEDNDTFFGQFEDNSNVYVALRASF